MKATRRRKKHRDHEYAMADRSAHRGLMCIRGATIVDSTGERTGDVLIDAGVIRDVASSIEPPSGARVLDASKCLVTPGLVDLHAHLREPGDEASETVESGARAGALGGYTALVAMPNTNPPIDSASTVRDVLALGVTACCEIVVAGAITVGRMGEQLAPIGEMAHLGVRLFTDDGRGVQDAQLMRRALEYARDLGVTLAEHCEDGSLAAGGSMHEGAWSSRLGISGQPALAEEAMLARDLALVGITQAKMHFLHLSTAGSVDLLRQAKAKGLGVTAEVTPHHLYLSDAAVASFDALYKVAPPLRGEKDVLACQKGCADKTFDAIATDHAPHPQQAKEEPFDKAPPGMIGLETALGVCYGVLVAKTQDNDAPALSHREFFSLFSWQPAHIAGLDETSGQGGPLSVGSPANICVFDPTATWMWDPASGASLSANSPYIGKTLRGRVRHTIYRGELVVIDGEAQR